MATKTLDNARKKKYNELYTRLEDIETELRNYKDCFFGKTVFCNCNDPYESNFFKYFAMNFKHLGLKKLIATCYDPSSIAYEQLSHFADGRPIAADGHRAYKIELTDIGDNNGDGAIDLGDVKRLLESDCGALTPLDGNGDFRSDECMELMKEADVVVTNPPWSLFRELVAQLIEYDKKFIILGNKNAISYKTVFTLIKQNKLWVGYRNINSDIWCKVPEGDDYEKMVDGVPMRHFMGCWFTNLDVARRHEELTLYKKYSPEEYPKYDNYDAIEVTKVAEIPCDYDGFMGVPITFLGKHDPDQFEIVKFRKGDGDKDL